MDWNAIGAVGDFASAILVGMTLVYLALQIRDVRKQTAITLSMGIQHNFDAVRIPLWTNPEVASFILRATTATEPLSPVDQSRLGAVVSQVLWAYVHVFHHSDGGMGRPGGSFLGPFFQSPAVRLCWEDTRGSFPPDFASEIDKIIEESPRT